MTETSGQGGERTYDAPEHGWTCFHCGETLMTVGAARDHFGGDPGALAACQIKAGAERGLLMALRKAEREISRRRDDDGPTVAAVVDEMRRMQSRHSDALRAAEEAGFERGVADMRAHGWRLNDEQARPDLYATDLPEVSDERR